MRRGSLRFVELVALTPICLPFVWPFLIHLPGALCSTGVTRLHRSYGSSDSCRTEVRCPAGLIASWNESSDRSVSTHPLSLRSLGLIFSDRTYRRNRSEEPVPPTRQGNAGVSWASPWDRWLAATKGRIEFVILRTNHSPPGAFHLPSRERSSFQLQQPGRPLTGTCTLLVHSTCNRTSG